jgi:hypothetical protein
MTPRQVSQAATAGAMVGLMGSAVIGGLVGLAVGAVEGPLAAGPLGFLLGAAFGGVIMGLPSAVVGGLTSWSLARCLVRSGADDRAGRRSFLVLGAVLGPVLGIAPFLLLDGGDLIADSDWTAALFVVLLVLGGVGAGALVWSHISVPVRPESGARLESGPSDPVD